MKTQLYRFHPETGADAEEIEIPPQATDADRAELAQMRRNGATFWWQENEPEAIAAGLEKFSRVERINIEFIAVALGVTLTFDSSRPEL